MATIVLECLERPHSPDMDGWETGVFVHLMLPNTTETTLPSASPPFSTAACPTIEKERLRHEARLRGTTTWVTTYMGYLYLRWISR